MAEATQTETGFLKDLYKLHLLLREERAKQEQLNRQQDNHNLETEDRRSQLDIMVNWTVDTPRDPEPVLADCSSQSVLGPTLSRALMQWCRMLVWPRDPQPTIVDPGATFMELAMSFMLFARCYTPVRRSEGDGMFCFVPSSAVEAHARQTTLAEVGQQMAYLLHQMCQLRLPPVIPNFSHAGCKSLYSYRLGAKHQSKGIVCRRKVLHQDDMIRLFAAVAQRSGSALPQQVFDIPVQCDIQKIRGELLGTVQCKQERVKRLVPTVRKMAGKT